MSFELIGTFRVSSLSQHSGVQYDLKYYGSQKLFNVSDLPSWVEPGSPTNCVTFGFLTVINNYQTNKLSTTQLDGYIK